MPSNKEKAARAKLFLPFDALKGFKEMLHEKERIVVPKRELSEDELALMDYTFSEVDVGKMVRIVYEDKDECVLVEGLVSKVDRDYRKIIRVVDRTIAICKIVEIELI